jgi:hypothetical protein
VTAYRTARATRSVAASGGTDVARAGAERIHRLGPGVAHDDDRYLGRPLPQGDDHVGAARVGELERGDHHVDPAVGQAGERAEQIVGVFERAPFQRAGVDPDGEDGQLRVAWNAHRQVKPIPTASALVVASRTSRSAERGPDRR